MSFDDEIGLTEFVKHTARTSNIETICQEYLDGKTFRRIICHDTGNYSDELEFYVSEGSSTIQKIVDDQEDSNTIRLRSPAPHTLPIVILKLFNDDKSYVIPTKSLNIHAILPHAPAYTLAAIICEINEREVVFYRHLITDKWYFYQNDYQCEQLQTKLNDQLNHILDSRSVDEQIRLIKSAHFIVSIAIQNATKYIYKHK